MRCAILITLTVAALSAGVQAEISASVVIVDNSSVLGPGWVTNDIVINTSSDWLSAVLVITPSTTGGIYQDSSGSEQSPSPAWIDMVPSLEFDSYISNGVLGETCLTDAAVDLGYSEIIFDENAIAISYYTTDTDDIGELTLARITLADTLSGTFSFIATASPAGGPKCEVINYPFFNGTFPEPATLALLAVGGLGVLIRRKKVVEQP